MLTRRMISSALLCLALAGCQGRGLQPTSQSATTPTTNPMPATTTSAPEVAPEQPSTTATTEPIPDTTPETVPVTRPRATVPATTPATTPAYVTSDEWAIPTYIVMCESGGRWDAYNPSSGASGPYQMLPLHFGGALAMNQSHEAQHAKAAQLWNGGRGRSHWAACL